MSYYKTINQREDREEKPEIKKMLRYTAKKVLWLINYSLSFSKKDSSKEIGIKVLGCFVILQIISLSFVIVSSVLGVILMNPLLTLGLSILTVIFLFKKEIKSLVKN